MILNLNSYRKSKAKDFLLEANFLKGNIENIKVKVRSRKLNQMNGKELNSLLENRWTLVIKGRQKVQKHKTTGRYCKKAKM